MEHQCSKDLIFQSVLQLGFVQNQNVDIDTKSKEFDVMILKKENGERATIYDICEWMNFNYPSDIIVDHDLAQIRKLFNKMLYPDKIILEKESDKYPRLGVWMLDHGFNMEEAKQALLTLTSMKSRELLSKKVDDIIKHNKEQKQIELRERNPTED